MGRDLPDLIHRTGWTFVQTFTGTLGADTLLDLGVGPLKVAAAAGLAAALVVVKEEARRQLANRRAL